MTGTDPDATPQPPAGGYQFEGRTVAAGRGWDWIVEAFALFRKQPGIWILTVVVLGVLFILIGMIPLLGSFASALLLPMFAGGLMLGCKDLDRGGALELEHLFAGFRQKTGDLAMVGAFNLISSVVIAYAVDAVIGGGVFIGVTPGGAEGAGPSIASSQIAMLLIAGLSVPLYMATWFAPVLIVLEGMTVVAALKASFFACLRNWIPFLVYSVVLLVPCLVAAVPVSLAYLNLVPVLVAAIPVGLGFLVLVPVLVASVYTAYRDIFCAGQEA
ncbi:MAG TPA: BPSS1780 family membrane protein [Burkholderiales bacterium]